MFEALLDSAASEGYTSSQSSEASTSKGAKSWLGAPSPSRTRTRTLTLALALTLTLTLTLVLTRSGRRGRLRRRDMPRRSPTRPRTGRARSTLRLGVGLG